MSVESYLYVKILLYLELAILQFSSVHWLTWMRYLAREFRSWKATEPASQSTLTILVVYESIFYQKMAEKYVFRTVEKQADGSWTTNPQTPLNYSGLRSAATKAMILASFVPFDLYAYRRGAANAIKVSGVMESDLQIYVGHQAGTSTFNDHYRSKMALIDAQGIIAHGREDERIIARPLARKITCYLDAREVSLVDADSQVKIARKAADTTRATLEEKVVEMEKAKESSDSDSVALRMALDEYRKEHAKAMNHWKWMRDFTLNKALKDKEEKLQRQRASNALGQTSSEEETTKSHGQTSQETNDEIMQELSVEESLSDIFDMTSSEDGQMQQQQKDASDETVEEITNEELLLARDSLVKQVCASQSDADTVASRHSTSSTTGMLAASTAAQQLEQQLQTFANEVNPFYFPLYDASPLFTAGEVNLSQAFQILSSEIGTTSHDRYAGCTDKHCPNCNKYFEKQDIPRTFITHVVNCFKKVYIERIKNIVFSCLGSQDCGSIACRRKSSTFGSEQAEVVKHSLNHLQTQRNIGYDRKLKGHKCTFQIDTETTCLYVCPSQDDLGLSDYFTHLQTCHGILDTSKVDYCYRDGIWSFGHAQIESHANHHHGNDDFDAITNMRSDQWTTVACKICYHDKTLRLSQRVHTYPTRQCLVAHMLKIHIIPCRDEQIQCSLCDSVIFAPDYPDHLILEHDLHLSAGSVIEQIGHNWSLFMSMAKSERHLLEDWTSWLDGLLSTDESMEATGDESLEGATRASTTSSTSLQVCSKRKRKSLEKTVERSTTTDKTSKRKLDRKKLARGDEETKPKRSKKKAVAADDKSTGTTNLDQGSASTSKNVLTASQQGNLGNHDDDDYIDNSYPGLEYYVSANTKKTRNNTHDSQNMNQNIDPSLFNI